jgi:hypothetical protein
VSLNLDTSGIGNYLGFSHLGIFFNLSFIIKLKYTRKMKNFEIIETLSTVFFLLVILVWAIPELINVIVSGRYSKTWVFLSKKVMYEKT